MQICETSDGFRNPFLAAASFYCSWLKTGLSIISWTLYLCINAPHKPLKCFTTILSNIHVVKIYKMIRTLFNLSFHLSFLWKSPKQWDSWLRLQKTLERLMPWQPRHPCLKRKILQNTRSLKRIQWNIPNTRSTTSNLSKSVPVKTWRQSNPDSSLCSVDKGKDNENTGGEGKQSCKNEKS